METDKPSKDNLKRFIVCGDTVFVKLVDDNTIKESVCIDGEYAVSEFKDTDVNTVKMFDNYKQEYAKQFYYVSVSEMNQKR